jgi:hypothetical protein
LGTDNRDHTKGLHKLEFGEKTILLEKGNHFIIVIIFSGIENKELLIKRKEVIDNIESKYKDLLGNWDGHLRDFEGTEVIMESLLSLEKISDETLKEIKERRGKMKIIEEWTSKHTKMIQSKLSSSGNSQIEEKRIEEN